MAISLLQPPQETFDLFDDIIHESEEKIIYLGPCKDVLGFFESMQFRCPERKNTADFLQEVLKYAFLTAYACNHHSLVLILIEQWLMFEICV